MYILYNSISYATGACLGSHSIGWPTLSNTSQAAQRRCATNPEGRFLPGFAMLCGAVLIFGAVSTRSGVLPPPAPLFGYLRMLCGSLIVSAVLSRQLRRGLQPCRHALLPTLSLSASSAHRLRSPLPIPSMPRISCGLPGILTLPGHCAPGLRYYCTQNGETGTGIATVLRSVCGRLPSSAPALTPCTCSANALPRSAGCALRYPGSQEQRQKQRERQRKRELIKARANLPCPVGRGQYMYGVRHKKSILGNGKSSFGNEKTH